ncbi:MAG: lipopolysaccharide core heptosyltransferase RfaQ [Leclercia sp.]
MEKPFRKILLIKMRFHGDMLLTTPVISTLKQNYPEAKIDMLLYKNTIPILSENPEIDMLYGISDKGESTLDKVKNVLSLIRVLRRNKYDLVINLTDQWIISFIVRFLNAKIKISQDFANRQSPIWKNSFTHLVPYSGNHIVERTLSTLKPLDLTHYVTETTMSYRSEHWEKIRLQLKNSGVTRQYVVIQPTARQLFKCWDNDKFSRTIDALENRGYQVILTSGPSADDLACVQEIAQGCKQKPVTDFAGKTSFPELGALIDHAELFIGVDSAPGHIAAAVKTPVICLFGATDHIFWRPWTHDIIQFWAGDYQPMPKRHELDRKKKYLSVIPAEDVIAATEKMLPEDATTVDMDGLL